MRVALGITNEENLEGIAESIRAVVASGREAMLDCEHFFDGYKGNRDYALAVARTAHEAGARWVVLCDTNGGTLPHEVERIVADVVKHVPGSHLGIHTHNDTENAVANTLAAVRQGCRQIQGTLNGLGERCGNANLTSIIPTLLLKSDFADRFETGVTPERLRKLTHASRMLDEILNQAPNRHAPYVGESAFATKAGIHASAILKEPETYEHVRPESVGNERRLLVSKQAGRSNVLASLERLGLGADKDDPRVALLLEEVKSREACRLCLRGGGSLVRAAGAPPPQQRAAVFLGRQLPRHGGAPPQCPGRAGHRVGSHRQGVRQRRQGAVVVGRRRQRPGQRPGPGAAKDLGRYQKYIETIELVDYKVRILTGGTEAVTRVLVETHDTATGERWLTVGVSPNIIDASFEALLDSINYKLVKDGAVAA